MSPPHLQAHNQCRPYWRFIISVDIILHDYPLAIIIFAFTLQNTKLLQSREVTLDGALAHRQSHRHLFACYCRRFFDEIEYFLLTFSEFRLRHISVKVSDILCVGSGIENGLPSRWHVIRHVNRKLGGRVCNRAAVVSVWGCPRVPT